MERMKAYLVIVILFFSVLVGRIRAEERWVAISGDHELSSDARDAHHGDRQLFMMSLSLGIAAYHYRGDGRTPCMSFDSFYIKNHHFFGARAASASFSPHTYGNDLSLLYGRAWVDDNLLFSFASGIGYSKYYQSVGLPIDIKILGLSSRKEGVSFGVHGFAFLAPHNQYFGVCLNLGLFIRGL